MIFGTQINRPLAVPIWVGNFAASGTSNVVTTAITTALNTAGFAGESLSLVNSNESTEGILITNSTKEFANLCQIVLTADKEPLTDSNGNEVFGRLTFATTVYTISYYTNVAGVETAFTMPSQNIDFSFNYVANFGKLDTFALLGSSVRNVSNDPNPNTVKSKVDAVVIASANTFTNPALSSAPNTNYPVILSINGILGFEGVHFTRSGQNITLSAQNIINNGCDIVTGIDTNGLPKFDIRVIYHY